MQWLEDKKLAAVLVGIFSGLYPSFYLSRFQPIQVLEEGLNRGGKGSALRRVLVVSQFSNSTVLMIGTLIFYQQIDFILSKKIGLDKATSTHDPGYLYAGGTTFCSQRRTAGPAHY